MRCSCCCCFDGFQMMTICWHVFIFIWFWREFDVGVWWVIGSRIIGPANDAIADSASVSRSCCRSSAQIVSRLDQNLQTHQRGKFFDFFYGKSAVAGSANAIFFGLNWIELNLFLRFTMQRRSAGRSNLKARIRSTRRSANSTMTVMMTTITTISSATVNVSSTDTKSIRSSAKDPLDRYINYQNCNFHINT